MAEPARLKAMSKDLFAKIVERHGGGVEGASEASRIPLVGCVAVATLHSTGPDSGRPPFPIELADLSRHGVGFRTRELVDIGDRLTIDADLDVGPVRWQCTVVWVHHADDGEHHVGTRFVE